MEARGREETHSSIFSNLFFLFVFKESLTDLKFHVLPMFAGLQAPSIILFSSPPAPRLHVVMPIFVLFCFVLLG